MADSYDLLIFGASRGLGLCLAKASVQRGEKVAAMVRAESDRSALSELGVTLIQGDAFSLDDCIAALRQAQPRRVISVLGGKNAAGRRIDALGLVQHPFCNFPAQSLSKVNSTLQNRENLDDGSTNRHSQSRGC